MGVEALVQFKDVYRQFKEVANNMIEHQQQDAMAKQQLLKDELGGGGAAVRAQEDNAPPPSVMRVNSRGMRSSSMVLRQTDDAQLNHFLSKTRSVLRRKGKILHRILVRGREEGAVRATVWCAPVVGQLLKMTERCGFGPCCVSGGVCGCATGASCQCLALRPGAAERLPVPEEDQWRGLLAGEAGFPAGTVCVD